MNPRFWPLAAAALVAGCGEVSRDNAIDTTSTDRYVLSVPAMH